MGAVTLQKRKICACCLEPKTWDQFYLRNAKPNGWCKVCYSNRSYLKTKIGKERTRFGPLIEAVKELFTLEEYLVSQTEAFNKIEAELKKLELQEAI